MKVIITTILLVYLRMSQSKLRQIHIIFRHGEKTPDNFLMFSTDPYKNETFYPYGPSALTNEGKRTMFTLGKIIRERYNAFLGDIYTPDILTAWASCIQRCQISLQLVLASLFPPKGALIWEEGFNWQPISYNSLPRNLDDMFCASLMEDYVKLYNEYCRNGNGKAVYKEAKPIFDYAQKHTNTTFNTIIQLFYLHTVLTGEEGYGLELPKWTNKIYPQPLNNLAVKHLSMQLATIQLKKRVIGKLMKKILEDSVNIIERNSSYRIHLYSGHDVTIAHVLNFLEIMYTSQAGWGACLILEQHEENGSHFIEVHYKDDKHSHFELLRFPNGEKRMYLHQLRNMVNELYADDDGSQSNVQSMLLETQMIYLQAIMLCLYYFYR